MHYKKIIIVIGLMNLTLLAVFTPLVSSDLFFAQDPVFFSWAGVVLIALWGLAYIAMAGHWQQLPGLLLVFAVEKLVFFLRWLAWLGEHRAQLDQVFAQDAIVGLFYAGYGLWDGLCALFFFWLVVQSRRAN